MPGHLARLGRRSLDARDPLRVLPRCVYFAPPGGSISRDQVDPRQAIGEKRDRRGNYLQNAFDFKTVTVLESSDKFLPQATIQEILAGSSTSVQDTQISYLFPILGIVGVVISLGYLYYAIKDLVSDRRKKKQSGSTENLTLSGDESTPTQKYVEFSQEGNK